MAGLASGPSCRGGSITAELESVSEQLDQRRRRPYALSCLSAPPPESRLEFRQGGDDVGFPPWRRGLLRRPDGACGCSPRMLSGCDFFFTPPDEDMPMAREQQQDDATAACGEQFRSPSTRTAATRPRRAAGTAGTATTGTTGVGRTGGDLRRRHGGDAEQLCSADTFRCSRLAFRASITALRPAREANHRCTPGPHARRYRISLACSTSSSGTLIAGVRSMAISPGPKTTHGSAPGDRQASVP